jgi:hypothetical protein
LGIVNYMRAIRFLCVKTGAKALEALKIRDTISRDYFINPSHRSVYYLLNLRT